MRGPWAAALLAAAAAFGQQPRLSDSSLDRLVSLPEDDALVSTASFRDLHGFDGTEHLAPVLLPAENRFRALESAEQVREAFALDPTLPKINASVWKAVSKELSRAPSGAELVAYFDGDLPPFLFTEPSGAVGSYRPALRALAVDWKDTRDLFPEAKDLDCPGVERLLAGSPQKSARFALQFGPVIFHELVHARQYRQFELEGPGPFPVEQEQEAYLDEVRFLLERLRGGAPLLSASSRLRAVYEQELRLYARSLDAFLDVLTANYTRAGDRPLEQVAAAARKSADEAANEGERAKAKAQLVRLDRYRDAFRKRLAKARKEWPALSEQASLDAARADLNARPAISLSLVVGAAFRARKRGGSLDDFQPLFEQAASGHFSTLKSGRGAFLASLKDACRQTGLKCRELVARLGKGGG